MSGRSSSQCVDVNRNQVELSIKDKLWVIELYENGHSAVSVTKDLGLDTSTVSNIRKHLNKYSTCTT